MPSMRFFNLVCEIDVFSYPQDAAGGEVPTPTIQSVNVPCCVQGDGPPVPTKNQGRWGSEAPVKIFLSPGNPPVQSAIQALKVRDALKVKDPITGANYPGTLILDGPAYDLSGRGAVWELAARDIR